MENISRCFVNEAPSSSKVAANVESKRESADDDERRRRRSGATMERTRLQVINKPLLANTKRRCLAFEVNNEPARGPSDVKLPIDAFEIVPSGKMLYTTVIDVLLVCLVVVGGSRGHEVTRRIDVTTCSISTRCVYHSAKILASEWQLSTYIGRRGK